MITGQIGRPTCLDWIDAEKAPLTGRRDGTQLENPARRTECEHHVDRCGFEIVGVTVRSRSEVDAFDVFGSEEEFEQDRMMSSLVAVLDPKQKVAFVYEGGGRVPLRWHIVGEVSSMDSCKEADEGLRNVWHALMAIRRYREAFRAMVSGDDAKKPDNGEAKMSQVLVGQP